MNKEINNLAGTWVYATFSADKYSSYVKNFFYVFVFDKKVVSLIKFLYFTKRSIATFFIDN